ncbi:YbhB/YbcL family Raf kinase inhibitor-like protein [Paraburkholderia pallida]|uniref:YbhB/YbcL family Raf kinase inhibitor-like protein n=1 Tax=Paraburkholderia pallida TaxID=2547399 RepID=A0A4P7CZ07_9BURK|nr:YbhB/YbcL family Raf kinase inhibitor-like protein [Paraburkholderia pallida]QBR01559.1 YbhB/YbcL family Raf kinase inhibitor-like protein [Paraburkholderia pallida]
MISRIIGKLLRGRRAGDRHLLWNELPPSPGEATLRLASPAFEDGMPMPRRFAGKGVGDNVSPAFSWSGVPAHAAELVMVMEDPDAPLRRPFVHLIASIPQPVPGGLGEGALSAEGGAPGITYGLSTFRKPGYSGPRALVAHGPHRYLFQLYALAQPSGIRPGAKREEMVPALDGKIIARGRLCGYFERT